MELCSMYVLRALAFTPAAIIRDAKVCRHSCRPIGTSKGRSSFSRILLARFQAVSARREALEPVNGRSAVARRDVRPPRRFFQAPQ